MSYRRYLYFVEDVRFRKYIFVLFLVFCLVAFIFVMSGFFAEDECGQVAYDLNDTSSALSKCKGDLSYVSSDLALCTMAKRELERNLSSVRNDFITCKNGLDTYNLTGKIPAFSGNLGTGEIFRWTVFGGVKLWMLLVLIPAMIVFQLCRILLQTRLKGKKKNLLWLDILWIAAVLVYLAGVLF